MCCQSSKLVVAFLALLILAVPASSIYVVREGPLGIRTSASIDTTQGLKTAVFKSDAGTIRVNLPDDLAAGDSISGTVYLNPAGTTEKAKSKNQILLSKHVIEIEKQLSPSAARLLTVDLPANIDNNELAVILRNEKGKRVSQVSIPAEGTSFALEEGSFQIPKGAQTGRLINILGSFDGNAANTSLSLGGSPVDCLAESPRKSIFLSPSEIVGKKELVLREGNTEIVQEFRNIDVRLTATKLNLQRGETTDITITYTGLEGIEEDLPLHLTCSGSADMEGGNVQNMQISPEQVGADGTFTENRRLVGNQIGNFNVTATVLYDVGVRVLNNNLVHIERTPRKMGNFWGVKVKTLDGKLKWLFFDKNPPPIVRICTWITITKSTTDEEGDTYVSEFQPADDPSQPCVLENKTVHVEGNPLKLPDGRWQIKIKLPNGNNGFIYVRAPVKPDLKLCKWIKVSGCKKLTSNTFEIGGYTETDDPSKPPPAPVAPPTPTPTPKPTPEVRVPVVKRCPEGAIQNERTVKDIFEVLERESTISMKLSTDKRGGNEAAAMAEWLKGLSTLGGLFDDDIPAGARAGAAVAAAALKYLDASADILSALGKSGLKNKSVLEVKVEIYISTKMVTAKCTSYEECVDGDWIKKKRYEETSKSSAVRKTVTIDPRHNDWDKITDSGTSRFDPDKFEAYAKELLKKELEKLQRNDQRLAKFKEKCQ